MDFLDTLDPEQRAAATATEPRVRAIAGAGSGKTRTLTARVQWLLGCGEQPEEIVVVTFSKQAALELQSRLGVAGRGVLAGTLHSLGYRIIRTERPWVKVADEPLSRRLIRKAVQEVGRDGIEPARALRMIGYLKTRGQWPSPDGPLGRGWERYHDLLHEGKLVDFNDLILVATELLGKGGAAATEWVGRWRHLLLDESQDTSATQWALLEALVPGRSPDTALFLVGDYQQGVYAFRGAQPTGMLEEADARFGPFTTYGIPRNYRSGHKVVGLANTLMRGQKGALELVAQRDLPAVVEVLAAESSADEAERIVAELQAAQAEGLRWKDTAVLVRTNAQHEALESACGRAGVPYVVVGGVGFYNRSEVLDVLAYLRLSQGWDGEALDRIYNRPSRYLGHAWKAELEAQGGWAAFAAGHAFDWSRSYMTRRAEELRETVRTLQGGGRESEPFLLAARVIDGAVGYRRWLLGEEPDDADEVKGEILDALLAAAQGHGTVEDFLDFAAECQRRGKPREGDGVRDRVTLSTVHRAKGLEWPLVVVAGCAEGLLPHAMGTAEEERRVAYVALTRARDRLILAYHGEPSPYLRELEAAGLLELKKREAPRVPRIDEDEEEPDDAVDPVEPGEGEDFGEEEPWECRGTDDRA